MKRRWVFTGIIWLGLAFMARQGMASEVRVDSTGGLNMVLTDETTEITPYMLGNPAGLALLDPQLRLDVNVPFYGVLTNSKRLVAPSSQSCHPPVETTMETNLV